jgi:hypothetical protein
MVYTIVSTSLKTTEMAQATKDASDSQVLSRKEKKNDYLNFPMRNGRYTKQELNSSETSCDKDKRCSRSYLLLLEWVRKMALMLTTKNCHIFSMSNMFR